MWEPLTMTWAKTRCAMSMSFAFLLGHFGLECGHQVPLATWIWSGNALVIFTLDGGSPRPPLSVPKRHNRPWTRRVEQNWRLYSQCQSNYLLKAKQHSRGIVNRLTETQRTCTQVDANGENHKEQSGERHSRHQSSSLQSQIVRIVCCWLIVWFILFIVNIVVTRVDGTTLRYWLCACGSWPWCIFFCLCNAKKAWSTKRIPNFLIRRPYCKKSGRKVYDWVYDCRCIDLYASI
jgi:hypothetical protein